MTKQEQGSCVATMARNEHDIPHELSPREAIKGPGRAFHEEMRRAKP